MYCSGPGKEATLKQYVWGRQYIDELVQIGLNQDPYNAFTQTSTENECERFFWVCQDSNFNVLGVLSARGDLVERYEYTPYGQRTVFSRGTGVMAVDRVTGESVGD